MTFIGVDSFRSFHFSSNVALSPALLFSSLLLLYFLVEEKKANDKLDTATSHHPHSPRLFWQDSEGQRHAARAGLDKGKCPERICLRCAEVGRTTRLVCSLVRSPTYQRLRWWRTLSCRRASGPVATLPFCATRAVFFCGRDTSYRRRWAALKLDWVSVLLLPVPITTSTSPGYPSASISP